MLRDYRIGTNAFINIERIHSKRNDVHKLDFDFNLQNKSKSCHSLLPTSTQSIACWVGLCIFYRLEMSVDQNSNVKKNIKCLTHSPFDEARTRVWLPFVSNVALLNCIATGKLHTNIFGERNLIMHTHWIFGLNFELKPKILMHWICFNYSSICDSMCSN